MVAPDLRRHFRRPYRKIRLCPTFFSIRQISFVVALHRLHLYRVILRLSCCRVTPCRRFETALRLNRQIQPPDGTSIRPHRSGRPNAVHSFAEFLNFCFALTYLASVVGSPATARLTTKCRAKRGIRPWCDSNEARRADLLQNADFQEGRIALPILR